MFVIKVLCLFTITGAFFGVMLYRMHDDINPTVLKEITLAHLLWVTSTAAAWILVRVSVSVVPAEFSIIGFLVTVAMGIFDVLIICAKNK